MQDRWNTATSSTTTPVSNAKRREHLLDAPRRFILTYGEPGRGSHNSGGLEGLAAQTHANEIKTNQFLGVPTYKPGDIVETHLIKDVPDLVTKLSHENVVYWAYFGHSGPAPGGPRLEQLENAQFEYVNASSLVVAKENEIKNIKDRISLAKRNGTNSADLNAELTRANSELIKLEADEKIKKATYDRLNTVNQNDASWYSGPGILYIAQDSVAKGNLTNRGGDGDAPATDLPKSVFLPDAQVRLFGCRGGWGPGPIAQQIKNHLEIPVFAYANSGGSIYTNDKVLGHGGRAVTNADIKMKLNSKKPIWLIPINGKPEFKEF